MAINFPDSPATNSTYTVNGRTWIYDGEKWVLQAVGASVALDGLSDVAITSSVANQVLQYNGTSSLWVNSSDLTLDGRLDVAEIRETVTDSTISAGVLTTDYASGCVFYQETAPSANFTVNLTNAPTNNGYAITVSVFVIQGATGYYPNVFQIAGSGQTIKWAGGTAPTPTSSSGKIDIFTFTCVRRGSAWTVFGNASLNY